MFRHVVMWMWKNSPMISVKVRLNEDENRRELQTHFRFVVTVMNFYLFLHTLILRCRWEWMKVCINPFLLVASHTTLWNREICKSCHQFHLKLAIKMLKCKQLLRVFFLRTDWSRWTASVKAKYMQEHTNKLRGRAIK